jgi:hypothetical protein
VSEAESVIAEDEVGKLGMDVVPLSVMASDVSCAADGVADNAVSELCEGGVVIATVPVSVGEEVSDVGSVCWVIVAAVPVSEGEGASDVVWMTEPASEVTEGVSDVAIVCGESVVVGLAALVALVISGSEIEMEGMVVGISVGRVMM